MVKVRMHLKENYEKFINSSLLIAGLVCLYFTSWFHYLLFHSLAEIFSIIVAGTIFVIAINSHTYGANRYLLFIGIGYLFVGFLDLMHTLSYRGMNIFTDYNYYANQVWIATRYLESLTLLTGLVLLKYPKWFRTSPTIWLFIVITTFIILSIFFWKTFPICFIEGVGLTPFKKISEYIICSIFFLTLYLLYRNRGKFSARIYHYLAMSLVFAIGSELAFSFYISSYGILNLVGHYLKIISFYMVYKAIVETSIRQPYDIIFRELKDNADKLRKLATLDPLTNLKNRRAFLEHCELKKRRADKRISCSALILGDIDFFKQINDSYGHECGDMVLEMVARKLEENLRTQDVISRWGGEEFLMMLPDCTLEEASGVAEKLRSKIAEHVLYCHGNAIETTISFGVTEYRRGTVLEDAIRRADKNLYQAKNTGKNRVIAAIS